jgi:pimeloyl-ACP methyl ester carboxylesterase
MAPIGFITKAGVAPQPFRWAREIVSMSWTMLIVGFLAIKATVLALFVLGFYLWVRKQFLPKITRIFQEKPLFIVPRGEPDYNAEDIRFPTSDGLTLRGCYLHSRLPDRRGVILFGLEFGSNRWAATSYCDRLRDAGYDVFAFEPRNQGESEKQGDYSPLQWATDRDLRDTQAALDYLTGRPDADPKGVGLFGVSKGGSVGLVAAANDPRINCVVTDGAFGTLTTVLPYVKKWAEIYSPYVRIRKMLPHYFYSTIAKDTIRTVAAERNVTYLKVEPAVKNLNRPLLMIHGGGDSYIKPEMAKSLCDRAKPGTAELWMVEKAKHNQAIHVAGDAYHEKVIAFFDQHLAAKDMPLRDFQAV